MPDSFLTLADLIKINDQNLADIEVTDLLNDAPLMAVLAADVASNGTKHSYTKETTAPVVGFRSPNQGRENSKSGDTLVTVDLKVLDASFSVDKAIADAYHRGRDAYIAREAKRHLRAAFFMAEQQVINGSDAAGFTGLADALSLANSMTVDAGGDATADADKGSSVYLVRTNDEGTDCTAITGQGGQVAMDESVVTTVEDPDGGRFTAYHTPVMGWLGLQVGSAYSVGRIANLAESAGTTLTDQMIYEALSRFPASRQPNLIVMNRRSLKQLRNSRTATNATGAPAPRPTEVDGIRIVTTDAITSTETILT